jgi:hypothetical protein
VPHHDEHVHGRPVAAALGKIRGDRPRRRSVSADDDRRDALGHLRGSGRIVHQPGGRVVVDVDEARREHEPARIDDRVATARLDGADGYDAPVLDAHGTPSGRRAGAVDDACVDDRRGRPVGRRILCANGDGERQRQCASGEESRGHCAVFYGSDAGTGTAELRRAVESAPLIESFGRLLMDSRTARSEFRFEKRRADAIVAFVGGESVAGCFFIADGTSRHEGPERVSDLLNSESGFFPFEIRGLDGPETVLYNRSRVITVQIFDNEEQREPGYAVAMRRGVSILLSDGRRIDGAVRIYRPEGRDRLSDWTRQPELFRYVEGDAATLIVNADHIVSVSEVPGS